MSIQKTREFILKLKILSFGKKNKVFDIDKKELGFFISKPIPKGENYGLLELYDVKDIENVMFTMKGKHTTYDSWWEANFSFFMGEKKEENFIGKLHGELRTGIRPECWFEDPEGNIVFTMTKGSIWIYNYVVFIENKQVGEIRKVTFAVGHKFRIRMDTNLTDEIAILIFLSLAAWTIL